MKSKKALYQEVEEALAILREGLIMHGGNVELADIDAEQGTVFLRLQGACVGCPLSEMTLKGGIEETLRQMIPEIKQVIQVDLPLEEPST